jgi:phage gpG-like protein
MHAYWTRKLQYKLARHFSGRDQLLARLFHILSCSFQFLLQLGKRPKFEWKPEMSRSHLQVLKARLATSVHLQI